MDTTDSMDSPPVLTGGTASTSESPHPETAAAPSVNESESQQPSPASPVVTRRLNFRDVVSGSGSSLGEASISPTANRTRLRGLLPSLEAIKEIRRLYDDECTNSGAILAAAKQAQPEGIPDALYSITAQVSSTLFGVTRPALIIGISAVNDNTVVQSLVEAGDILHVHRQPRNSLLFYLRTEEAKIALAGQRCTFMGLNGQVCDQVSLEGTLFSARARGSQVTQYHLIPGKPSQHAFEVQCVAKETPHGNACFSGHRGEKRCRQRFTDSPVEDAPEEISAATAPRHVDVQLTTKAIAIGDSDTSLQITIQSISPSPSTRASQEYTRHFEVQRGTVRRSAIPATLEAALPLLEGDAALQQSGLDRELRDNLTEDALTPTQTDENASSTEVIRRNMAKNHLRFMGKMFRLLRLKSTLANDFIRVHLISRAVAASTPASCSSVAKKWKALFGQPWPVTKAALFSMADSWEIDEADHALYRASEALALFELLVMAAAPGIHAHDGWLHLLCGFESPWIGDAPTRLLHSNALLGLLRSEMGTILLSALDRQQIQHSCVSVLHELHQAGDWFSEAGGVLALEDSSLGLTWREGTIPTLIA
ncbi:hypothetical protein PInf_010158 [Phytophthora infestans]|nr:hypothetical protein PInf_010158 [Phytophthora infestans]